MSSTIIYGIHPVVQALTAKKRKIEGVMFADVSSSSYKKIFPLLKDHIPVKKVSKEYLNNLAGNTDHQGVVAMVQPFPFKKTFFDKEKHPFIVLLDGLEDPRNVGALLRSCYCTNVSGVILPKKRTAPMEGVVFKSSAGLAELMDIYQPSSSISGLEEAKKAGYNIYLAALGGKYLQEIEFKEPICLVIGNEGEGISKELLNKGEKVMLPQKNSSISYNASVAGGILMFYISFLKK